MNFSWTQNRFLSRPLVLSLIMTAGLFLANFMFLVPFFQTKDDIFIVFLLKGIGFSHTPCEFLIFINVLLGLMLKALYAWMPQIAWYSLLLYSALFLSTLALGWVVFTKVKNALLLFLMILIFTPFFVDYYALPTYTATSCLASLSGVLLLIFLPHRLAAKLLAGLLLFLSSLIRFKAFFVFLPFFGVFWFHQWLEKKEGCKGQMAFMLLVGLLVLAAHSYDSYDYRVNPGWEQAKEYAEDYNRLVEYKVANYGKDQKLFESYGWSPVDFREFAGFWHVEKFNPNTVHALSRLAHYDWPAKINTWKSLVAQRLLYVCVALFLMFLFFSIRDRSTLVFLILNTFLVFSTVFLLMLFFKLVPRIFYSQMFYWVFSNALMVASRYREGPEFPKLKWNNAWGLAFLLVAGLVCLVFTTRIFLKNQAMRKEALPFSQSLEHLPAQSGQLLVCYDNHIPIDVFPASDDFEIFRNFNFVGFAWLQWSPLTQTMLDQFKITDLFRDMVDRKDVLMIFDKGEVYYLPFMKEAYHLSVDLDLVYEGYQLKLYRVLSKKAPGRE